MMPRTIRLARSYARSCAVRFAPKDAHLFAKSKTQEVTANDVLQLHHANVVRGGERKSEHGLICIQLAAADRKLNLPRPFVKDDRTFMPKMFT